MNPIVKSYLEELKHNLTALPVDEAQDVVSFYQEFILDAGFKERWQLDDELGTPKQLAHKILADYYLAADPLLPTVTEPAMPITAKKSSRHNLHVIWWIVLGMLAAPIGIPAILLVVGAFFAILMLIIALVVIFISVMLACLFSSGFILIKITPLLMTAHWAVGCFYLGIALIMLALLIGLGPLLIKLLRYLTNRGVVWIRHLGQKFLKTKYFQKKSLHRGDRS